MVKFFASIGHKFCNYATARLVNDAFKKGVDISCTSHNSQNIIFVEILINGSQMVVFFGFIIDFSNFLCTLTIQGVYKIFQI